MYCDKCGKLLDDGSKFCDKCGSQLGDVAETTETITVPEQTLAPKTVNPKKKGLKWLLIILAVIIVLGVAAYFAVPEILRSKRYNNALSLMDSGNYAQAYDEFKSLEDYKDSEKLALECKNETDYLKASELYGEGSYYAAYQAFSALGNYKDSSDMLKSCIQPAPSSGLITMNSSYGTGELVFNISTGENGGRYTYLKFYTVSGEFVADVFIAPSSTVSLQLKSGTYKINEAYGADWFGTADMFGDKGTYTKVLFNNNTTDQIYLEANYTYTLSLDIAQSEGDSVGSEDINMSDF